MKSIVWDSKDRGNENNVFSSLILGNFILRSIILSVHDSLLFSYQLKTDQMDIQFFKSHGYLLLGIHYCHLIDVTISSCSFACPSQIFFLFFAFITLSFLLFSFSLCVGLSLPILLSYSCKSLYWIATAYRIKSRAIMPAELGMICLQTSVCKCIYM